MTTITLRADKGSPLTNAEVDDNFDNLNTAKIEQTTSTGSVKITSGTTAQRDGSPSAGFFRYNTTTSEFEGYTDSWNPLGITYSTSIPAATTTLRLTGSNADTDDIAFAGTGLIGVTRTNGSTLTFSTTANNYTHPNHTGDVTSTADGATVIASNKVDADNLKVTGNGNTTQFLRSDGDGTFTWATPVDTNTVYTHPNHSGEVTSTADGATIITNNVVDAGNLKVTGNGGTTQFLRSDGDGTFTWAVPVNTVYTHPNHSGEVTSTGDGATVVASNVIDADNLKVTGNGSTTQFLRSDGDGTFTWAVPVDTNTVYTHPNHSGDVTSSGDGATTIGDNKVTYAKMQNVSATNRILGRDTAGAGDVEEITPANLRTMLNVANGANAYSLPLATNTARGGIELFNNTDQSVAANTVTSTASRTYGLQLNSANQGVVNVPWVNTVYTHPNHSGDVTSSGDGATSIANDAVTYAKMQNVSATNRILGRDTAGAGNVEEITPGNLRTMLNIANGANNYSHPNHSGDVTSSGDGTTTIANDAVNSDKLASAITLVIKDSSGDALKTLYGAGS